MIYLRLNRLIEMCFETVEIHIWSIIHINIFFQINTDLLFAYGYSVAPTVSTNSSQRQIKQASLHVFSPIVA